MRRNLKELTRAYKYDDIDGQHPISKTDGEIIHELFSAIGLLPKSAPLMEILNSYKDNKKDSEILRDIRDFIDEAIESGDYEDGDAKGEKDVRQMIEFEESIFPVEWVHLVGKVDSYQEQRPVYGIILNETIANNKIPPLANKTFWFYNPDMRQKKYEELKSKLEASNLKVRFI